MFGLHIRSVLIASCCVVAGIAPRGFAGDLTPRPPIRKPVNTIVDDRHETRFIYVKFHDGLTVRLREGELTDLGTGALDDPAARATCC